MNLYFGSIRLTMLLQSFNNYTWLQLMRYAILIWERCVLEAMLREKVMICEQQYGFIPRKSTLDANFALRILIEKHREGKKELQCVIVDLQKPNRCQGRKCGSIKGSLEWQRSMLDWCRIHMRAVCQW